MQMGLRWYGAHEDGCAGIVTADCDGQHTVKDVRRVCEAMEACPGTLTVPVSHGVGNGSVSMHPQKALKLIRETAAKAAHLDPALCLFPMPEHFVVEVNYRKHFDARSASFYPGARLEDSCTVVYESDDWMDCLKFFHFCLLA